MERKEENKMFKFATKELAQDAFICWCINWINYPQSKLYNLGKDFLSMLLTDEKGNKEIDINENTSVRIFRQYQRIDILLVVNNKYIVIIEDKINSFNRGQLSTNRGEKDKVYKNKLINLLDEKITVDKNGVFSNIQKKNIPNAHKKWEELGIEEFSASNVIEVYVKTGIMNPSDKAVHAIKVDAQKILNTLKKYITESEIVEDYYTCIKFKVDLRDARIVDEIVNNNKLEIGTAFMDRAMCYNCFSKTTNRYYNSDFEGAMYLKIQGGGMKLNQDFSIWVPRAFGQKNWKNEIDLVKGTIIEKNLNSNKIEEPKDNKYRYVFIRKLDEFADEYFEFIGIYCFEKMEDNCARVWKKVDLGNSITLDLIELKKILERR